MSQSTRERRGPPTSRSEADTDEALRARDQAEQASTRAQADALLKDQPRVGDPRQKPLSPAEAAEPGEPAITMHFPHAVLLTTQHYRMVRFEAGLNEVPQSLADHPYLAASGATVRSSHRSR